MGKCDNCRLRKESAKAFDIHWLGEDDCPYEKCPMPDFPKTNADRIRQMSDEELKEWFCQQRECDDWHCPYCNNGVFGAERCGLRSWLKSPADKEGADA